MERRRGNRSQTPPYVQKTRSRIDLRALARAMGLEPTTTRSTVEDCPFWQVVVAVELTPKSLAGNMLSGSMEVLNMLHVLHRIGVLLGILLGCEHASRALPRDYPVDMRTSTT